MQLTVRICSRSKAKGLIPVGYGKNCSVDIKLCAVHYLSEELSSATNF
jgi:hypothetical protein